MILGVLTGLLRLITKTNGIVFLNEKNVDCLKTLRKAYRIIFFSVICNKRLVESV